MRALPEGVDSPAWLHGESAFTTVRTRHGRPLLPDAHLARLHDTCAFLGLPVPQTVLPDLDILPWGLLRLTVTASGTFWSHRPLTPGLPPVGGVDVRLTGVQVHPQLGVHKTGNYVPYRLAAQQAAPAFEGWLTDAAGHVVDGSRTSPLLELDGELVCPAGGLPGVTRAAFLAGRPHVQRAVSVTDLPRMTGAWLCGSGVGVVPVRRLDGPGLSLELPVRWPQTTDDALVWPEDDPATSTA
ncbi:MULTISPECIES: aminotransferase class IV [Deinococcus]|uniref:Aminotransferase class IV n=1 Tax=Deinococcus rufus TaxID=2136097 RepID=A0ABV7Z531_9DEIO|nr:aminotransferase class IV [Deinococcus sp. AB2017081]WQE95512.1 aminotransferase class IV [Deinococcus sp. AB2017081]